ncbi:hypothetical protein VKT23_012832 [Stygiomarasmius scandens]|uniref:Uncharacterized protein n=1 Tax=Marasmiellus scandens TaxID=2682957 RepID=A0ABR1J749_9AGAR
MTLDTEVRDEGWLEVVTKKDKLEQVDEYESFKRALDEKDQLIALGQYRVRKLSGHLRRLTEENRHLKEELKAKEVALRSNSGKTENLEQVLRTEAVEAGQENQNYC